jgi:hypothetical protein
MIEARGKLEGINMGSVGIFILWLEATRKPRNNRHDGNIHP